jgi:hypothetical protein
MSEEENTDKPEDVLPADDPLAVAISLAGEEFVDDASMDVPELSKEQLESLLAGVREDFGETSGEDAPPSEDVLTLAILEGSATSEQQEEHEKLLQDDEYRNSFEERESTHSLLAEALPATFHGETEIEAPPLAEGKKEELLSGVRERFEQEEVVKEERTERKVVPFSKYFLPLAAAAAVVFAAVRLYDGGDGGSGGGEVQVASAIEFGDWPENNIFRGGEDGNQTTPFPTWVKFQPYSNKTDRQEWLDRETPGKAIVKVWVDGDHGVVKIHRPGKKDVEEIPLDDEKDERTQVLAILEKLRKEISGKP